MGAVTRDRDRILDEFRRAFAQSGARKALVVKKSGVCHSTLRNWETGRTRSPLISTMRAALTSLGYEITVQKRGR